MAKYKDFIITNMGLEALKTAMRINSSAIITNIYFESDPEIRQLNKDQLVQLDSNQLQEWNRATQNSVTSTNIFNIINNHEDETENAKHLTVKLSNSSYSNDFEINAIVIECKNPSDDEVIPLAVSIAEDPEKMSAHKDDDVTYTFTADLFLNIDRADKITVKYSPDGLVKEKALEDHIKKADEKYIHQDDDSVVKAKECQNLVLNPIKFISPNTHLSHGLNLSTLQYHLEKKDAQLDDAKSNLLATKQMLEVYTDDLSSKIYKDMIKTINDQRPDDKGNANIDIGVYRLNVATSYGNNIRNSEQLNSIGDNKTVLATKEYVDNLIKEIRDELKSN